MTFSLKCIQFMILGLICFQKKHFLLLTEDDIHFIHATRQPTSSTTSTAWHMCTCLLDILEKISAATGHVLTPQNCGSNYEEWCCQMVQGRGGCAVNINILFWSIRSFLFMKLPRQVVSRPQKIGYDQCEAKL